jgi:hypothetical protein
MKKIILLASSLMLLLSGCGQSSVSDVNNSVQEESVGTIAEFNDCKAELQESEIFMDNGEQKIRVYVEYTNNNSDGMYMLESFVVNAFQNDVELTDCTDINDDEQSSTLIQEVKEGQSIVGSYVFTLTNASDDVEVRVCTPNADEELLALKVYAYDSQDTE